MDYRTGFRDGYNAAREDILGAFGASGLPISMPSADSASAAEILFVTSKMRAVKLGVCWLRVELSADEAEGVAIW